MRSALFSVALLALSAPTLAHAGEAQRDMERIGAQLSDPRSQAAISGGLMAILDAFMDMRVDGIAKALEPMNGGKPLKMKGRTIREIAERRDPNFEEKMEGGSKAMVAGAGAMATAVSVMLPQLEAAMERASEEIDRAKDRMPDAK
jgi:hypothetical protein